MQGTTQETKQDTTAERERILSALGAWIKQRPGLEYGNYASGWNDKEGRAAYFAEMRSITRDLHDARELLNAVALRPSITADALREAFRAFSGRLSWHAATDRCATCNGAGWFDGGRRACHRCKGLAFNKRDFLDYCTGQYWPTEYRRAACAVLRTALWDRWRADAQARDDAGNYDNGATIRDRILKTARAELSRGVYRRWFASA